MEIEEIKGLYAQGKSCDYIAKLAEVTPKTIANRLKKEGVKCRTSKESIKLSYKKGYRKHTPMTQESRNKLSDERKGNNNPNWKGGVNHKYYKRLAFDVLKKERICELCNSKEKIVIHHKDFNHYNNELTNLQVLCDRCHKQTHSAKRHRTKKGEFC